MRHAFPRPTEGPWSEPMQDASDALNEPFLPASHQQDAAPKKKHQRGGKAAGKGKVKLRQKLFKGGAAASCAARAKDERLEGSGKAAAKGKATGKPKLSKGGAAAGSAAGENKARAVKAAAGRSIGGASSSAGDGGLRDRKPISNTHEDR